MKRQLNTALVALFLLCLPLSAAAAMQGKMGGMHGMRSMVMLGVKTQSGVKAMGHIMSMPKHAAQSGTSHHFMVMFNDAQRGTPITEGAVALKVTDPAGETTAPVRLMPMSIGMAKGFGAAVQLAKKGTYRFEVGCKLSDGKVRHFFFSDTIK